MGSADDEEAVVDTRLRVRGVSPSVSQSVSAVPQPAPYPCRAVRPGPTILPGVVSDVACFCAWQMESLRVCIYIYMYAYQVESLRVADASIMPAMPGAQLGATVFAIAEKAADILLGAAAPGAPSTPPDEA